MRTAQIFHKTSWYTIIIQGEDVHGLCLLSNPNECIQQNMLKLHFDQENVSTENDGIADKVIYLL